MKIKKTQESPSKSIVEEESVAQLTATPRNSLVAPSVDPSLPPVQGLQASLSAITSNMLHLQMLMSKISEKNMDLMTPRGSFVQVSNSTASTATSTPLTSSALSPVLKATNDFTDLPDEEEETGGLALNTTKVEESDISCCERAVLEKESELLSKLEEMERQNKVLEHELTELKQSKEVMKQVMSEFVQDMEEMKSRLGASEEENAHFRHAIQEYNADNKRLQEALLVASSNAATATRNDNNQSQDDHSDALNNSFSRTEHSPERCQTKMHELWQTVKTLKSYVEAFRAEKEELARQRDEAMASAERAWDENSKLAGHTNANQKIKYLQAIKNENIVLTQKVKELQARAAAKHTKALQQHNAQEDATNCTTSTLSSPQHLGKKQKELNPAEMGIVNDFEKHGQSTDAERNALFRKMWSRNKKLQSEIERLRDQQRKLTESRRRFNMEDSRSSSISSSFWH
jgi:chromosome segregation ATPase